MEISSANSVDSYVMQQVQQNMAAQEADAEQAQKEADQKAQAERT